MTPSFPKISTTFGPCTSTSSSDCCTFSTTSLTSLTIEPTFSMPPLMVAASSFSFFLFASMVFFRSVTLSPIAAVDTRPLYPIEFTVTLSTGRIRPNVFLMAPGMLRVSPVVLRPTLMNHAPCSSFELQPLVHPLHAVVTQLCESSSVHSTSSLVLHFSQMLAPFKTHLAPVTGVPCSQVQMFCAHTDPNVGAGVGVFVGGAL